MRISFHRPRRRQLLALITTVLLAGFSLGLAACGSSGSDQAPAEATAADFPAPDGRTIEQIYDQFAPVGEDGQPGNGPVALPGAGTFDVGVNRFPFGVFEVDGSQVADAQVALYFAKSANSKVQGPLPARWVSFDTKPAYRSIGADAPGEVSSFYVVDEVRFNRKGPWLAIALIRQDGKTVASRIPSPEIGAVPSVAKVGDKAPVVKTPTLKSVGGEVSKIDTRQPPSSMHEVSFDEVAGKKPAVIAFATPALCTSRVCGPVVDVVEQVKAEHQGNTVFIHNEVYIDNDPKKTWRPQLFAFGLRTEPWVFLIGSDGRIKDRIEGPIGVEELTAKVDQLK